MRPSSNKLYTRSIWAAICCLALTGGLLPSVFALLPARNGEEAETEAEHDGGRSTLRESLLGLGEFDWSNFSSDLTLDDIDIQDSEGESIISIERITLSFLPARLLQRQIHISHLEVEGLRLNLPLQEDATFSLPDALAPLESMTASEEIDDQASSVWRIQVENARILDSRITAQIATGILDINEFSASNISISGGLSKEEILIQVPTFQADRLAYTGLIGILSGGGAAYREGLLLVDWLLVQPAEPDGGQVRFESTKLNLGEEPARLHTSLEIASLSPQALISEKIDPTWLPQRINGQVDFDITLEPQPSGSMSAVLDIQGLPPAIASTPQVSAHLSFPTDLRADIRARLSAEELVLDSVDMKLNGYSLEAEGSVDLLDGALTLGSTLEGDISGRIDLSGSTQELVLNASLETVGGTIGVEGSFHPKAGRIQEMMVSSESLNLHEISEHFAPSLGLAGSLSFFLSAKGSVADPHIYGRFAFKNPELMGRRLEHEDLVVRIAKNDNEQIRFGVEIPNAAYIRGEALSGEFTQINAEGSFKDFQIGWFPLFVDSEDVGPIISGEISVLHRHKGLFPTEEPGTVQTMATLSNLQLKLGNEDFRSVEDFVVRYQDSTIILQDLNLSGTLGRFYAGGAIGPSISFVSYGRVHISPIVSIVPQLVRASGTVTYTLEVSGTPSRPSVSGGVYLSESLRVLPRGMIREMIIDSLSVGIENNLVRIDQLEGLVATGTFSSHGFLQMEGLNISDADLFFSGNRLPLRFDHIRGEVNANLRLNAIGERLLLSGSIDAVRGKYEREFSLSSFSLAPSEPGTDLLEARPFIEKVDLALRLSSRGSVDILARAGAFGIDMVLDANLLLGGTALNPRLEGRVDALRGEIQTPTIDLPIVRGFADFMPAPDRRMHSRLYIRAEGETILSPVGRDPLMPKRFVSLVLEGDIDKLTLDLQSQPSLEQIELLSLLATGSISPSHILPGERSHIESALLFAGTRLAEPLTLAISESLEDILNLDMIAADLTYQGLALSAGTEISRRLRLEGAIQQSFVQHGPIALARAQYLLSNYLFLEAATETQSDIFLGTTVLERAGRRSSLELRARVLGSR